MSLLSRRPLSLASRSTIEQGPTAALAPTAADRQRSHGPLMRQDQPLALLPTWWFWNEPDTIRLATPWLAVGSAAGVAFSTAIASLPISLTAALAIGISIGIATPLITLGMLERYVRRSAQRRRAGASSVRLT